MPSGIGLLFLFAGALALLVFGMRLMGAGLQQMAGARMRQLPGEMAAGRTRGMRSGFTTTLIVQYSSAVSVMVARFVNSGILSLRQAIPVFIGTNIGTTIKLLVIVAVGFTGIQLHYIALPLLAIVLPVLLLRCNKARAAVGIIVGLALLFLALDLMQSHLPHPGAATMHLLRQLEGMGLLSHLLFIVIGAALAFAVRSSSVALVLTVVLCDAGTLGYATGAALVLGENIGTTFIVNSVAQAGNVWAKRAARAHLLIKLVGVAGAWLLFTPVLSGIAAFTEHLNGASPFLHAGAVKWALAYLHIAFNLVNGLIMLQCIPLIERAAVRLVPARSTTDTEHRLEYMEDLLMPPPPELSLVEARREVLKFGRLCRRMLGMVQKLLIERDPRERAVLAQHIAKYETITDRVETEVARFLLRTGMEVREEQAGIHVRGLMAVIGSLENVGDILLQMTKALERKYDEQLWFTPEQRQGLLDMEKLVDQAFQVMLQNLEGEDEVPVLDKAVLAEHHINRHRDQLRRTHLQNVEQGGDNLMAGLVHADLYSNFEKVGDHLLKVSEALAGRV